MRITNAERADLIDALQLAAETLEDLLDSDDHAREDVRAYHGQIRRYRALRKRLLAEERATEGCKA